MNIEPKRGIAIFNISILSLWQVLDFPGGKVGYTSEMRFIPESSEKRVPCFRVLDDNGELIKGSDFQQVHIYNITSFINDHIFQYPILKIHQSSRACDFGLVVSLGEQGSCCKDV